MHIRDCVSGTELLSTNFSHLFAPMLSKRKWKPAQVPLKQPAADAIGEMYTYAYSYACCALVPFKVQSN